MGEGWKTSLLPTSLPFNFSPFPSLFNMVPEIETSDNNNNNNNNLYLSVKAKIAVTEPLNGDTISEIYIYININVNIKVLKKNLF